jgi:hypothetical protein
MGKAIPLTPSTQRSGGMLDDVVARITEARAVMFDYNGNADVEVPALRISLEDEEGDDLTPQHYKAGDPAKVQPSDDGMNFEAVDDDANYEGIGKKTLAGTFLRKLDEVSKGKFEKYAAKVGDLSCLEGILARFTMQPKPKTGMGEQKYPDFPVITEIIEAPWEKEGKGGDKGKKAKGKQKAIDEDEDEEEETEEAEEPTPKKKKKAAEPEPEEDEDEEADEDEDEGEENDIEAKATKLLRNVVKNKGTLARAAAGQAVRELAKEDEDEDWKAITTTVLSDKFLKAGAKAGSWSFDGQKVGPAKK